MINAGCARAGRKGGAEEEEERSHAVVAHSRGPTDPAGGQREAPAL